MGFWSRPVHISRRAYIEALDEGVISAPLESEYNPVGFNFIFVWVCCTRIFPNMLCPNVLRKYSWDNEESSHDMTCMMRKHVHGGQWKCLNKCFLWAAPAVYLRQLHDPKEPKIVFPFWWDFIGISWLGQLVSLHHSHDVVVWQLRCPAGKCASHCRLLLMPLNFTLQAPTSKSLPTTSIISLTHM